MEKNCHSTHFPPITTGFSPWISPRIPMNSPWIPHESHSSSSSSSESYSSPPMSPKFMSPKPGIFRATEFRGCVVGFQNAQQNPSKYTGKGSAPSKFHALLFPSSSSSESCHLFQSTLRSGLHKDFEVQVHRITNRMLITLQGSPKQANCDPNWETTLWAEKTGEVCSSGFLDMFVIHVKFRSYSVSDRAPSPMEASSCWVMSKVLQILSSSRIRLAWKRRERKMAWNMEKAIYVDVEQTIIKWCSWKRSVCQCQHPHQKKTTTLWCNNHFSPKYSIQFSETRVFDVSTFRISTTDWDGFEKPKNPPFRTPLGFLLNNWSLVPGLFRVWLWW